MDNILLLTDFSSAAFHAARYAASLSQQYHVKELVLFHAYEVLVPTPEIPVVVSNNKPMYEDSLSKLQALHDKLQKYLYADTIVRYRAEAGSLPGIAWQLIKELTETIFIPAKIWRQLPQDRSEFVAESEKTGGKKIGERYFCVTQFFHVSNKTRSFDAKDEVRRRFRSPPEIARGKLKRIK